MFQTREKEINNMPKTNNLLLDSDNKNFYNKYVSDYILNGSNRVNLTKLV